MPVALLVVWDLNHGSLTSGLVRPRAEETVRAALKRTVMRLAH